MQDAAEPDAEPATTQLTNAEILELQSLRLARYCFLRPSSSSVEPAAEPATDLPEEVRRAAEFLLITRLAGSG